MSDLSKIDDFNKNDSLEKITSVSLDSMEDFTDQKDIETKELFYDTSQNSNEFHKEKDYECEVSSPSSPSKIPQNFSPLLGRIKSSMLKSRKMKKIAFLEKIEEITTKEIDPPSPKNFEIKKSKSLLDLDLMLDANGTLQPMLSREISTAQPMLSREISTVQPLFSREISTVQPLFSREISTVQPLFSREISILKSKEEKLLKNSLTGENFVNIPGFESMHLYHKYMPNFNYNVVIMLLNKEYYYRIKRKALLSKKKRSVKKKRDNKMRGERAWSPTSVKSRFSIFRGVATNPMSPMTAGKGKSSFKTNVSSFKQKI